MIKNLIYNIIMLACSVTAQQILYSTFDETEPMVKFKGKIGSLNAFIEQGKWQKE